MTNIKELNFPSKEQVYNLYIERLEAIMKEYSFLYLYEEQIKSIIKHYIKGEIIKGHESYNKGSYISRNELQDISEFYYDGKDNYVCFISKYYDCLYKYSDKVYDIQSRIEHLYIYLCKDNTDYIYNNYNNKIFHNKAKIDINNFSFMMENYTSDYKPESCRNSIVNPYYIRTSSKYEKINKIYYYIPNVIFPQSGTNIEELVHNNILLRNENKYLQEENENLRKLLYN